MKLVIGMLLGIIFMLTILFGIIVDVYWFIGTIVMFVCNGLFITAEIVEKDLWR